MKKYAKIVILVGVLMVGIAFSVWGKDRTSVSVTLTPQRYLVERIGGVTVDVNVMVRPGADPHVYEPTPQQMANLGRSKLYFSIGNEFEKIWLPRFIAANHGLTVVPTDVGIPKLEMKESNENHDNEHHSEHGSDPHIWLSPLLLKIQAMHVYHGLVKENPENKVLYAANYANLQLEFDMLYLEIRKILDRAQVTNEFAVFHPSWGYFANCFGLTQIAIEVEGKEPKPQQLQRIIEALKNRKIRTIFVQPQFSSRSAQIIANGVGANLRVLDPLKEDLYANLIEAAKSIAATR